MHRLNKRTVHNQINIKWNIFCRFAGFLCQQNRHQIQNGKFENKANIKSYTCYTFSISMCRIAIAFGLESYNASHSSSYRHCAVNILYKQWRARTFYIYTHTIRSYRMIRIKYAVIKSYQYAQTPAQRSRNEIKCEWNRSIAQGTVRHSRQQIVFSQYPVSCYVSSRRFFFLVSSSLFVDRDRCHSVYISRIPFTLRIFVLFLTHLPPVSVDSIA